MSQCRDILRWLERGNSITSIEALRRFGSFRLAARILDLRRDGHPIDRAWAAANGKRYAKYRLTKKAR